LAWRIEIGALPAMCVAVSTASWTTAPGSHSRLTMPQRSASSAEKGRPVSRISLARRKPTARGRVWVPPAPGMMPIVTSVSAKRAVRAA
jgi:hypothetical protein